MTTKQQQAAQAYFAECAKTDAGKHGASLRMHTEKEQELYDAWHSSIKNCTVWRSGPDAPSPNTTWHVLSKDLDEDPEMWTCRIVVPERPEGEIADCYAWAIREMAEPAEDETEQESQEQANAAK